jgi:hypothetical protein
MESLLPFLQGTCTPYNMPVYPGAQRIIANALTEPFSLGFCIASSVAKITSGWPTIHSESRSAKQRGSTSALP